MTKKLASAVKTVRMWTKCYRPFMMGGNVNRHIATTLPIDSEVDLGRGFKGYAVLDSMGGVRYVCAVSGGLLGDDLKAIQKDIAECPKKKIMTDQIAKMAIEGKTAEEMPPAEFWKHFKENT